jgi:putative membrane protein
VRFLLGWVFLTLAVAATSTLLSGVEVDGGVVTYLWVAALLAGVNVVLGPLLRLVSAPLVAVTLGLSSLVVNGVLVLVTDWLSPSFQVDGLGTAVLAAFLISGANLALWVIFFPDLLEPDELSAPR